MNKELEALNYLNNDLRLMKCLDIVEEAKIKSAYEYLRQALQRLEAIDNSNPSEALEKVNKVLENCYEYEKETSKNAIAYISKEPLIEIQQALLKLQEQEKVLEIIKEKDVDMYSLRRCETVEEYNIHFAIDEYQELTQEEFDLLKRWVENE